MHTCDTKECTKLAAHALVVSKDGEDYKFYGCKNHFMDICAYYINEGGYAFKKTEPILQNDVVATKNNQTTIQPKTESKVESKPVPLPPSAVDKVKPIVSAVPVVPVMPAPVMPAPVMPAPIVSATIVPAPTVSASINLDNSMHVMKKTDEGRGVAIDETGRMRAMIDEAEAKEAGFTVQRPLYTMGTKVVQLGVDNFRRSREQWESRPKVKEACDALIETIESEDRQDVVWSMPEMYMLPDGRVGKEGKAGSITLANSAVLGQLMNRSALATTGKGYLERCSPALRAMNVNTWLNMTTDNMESKLRTRKNMEDREIFAIVSPRYSVFDANEIAKIIKDICPEESRAEVIYNGFDTRFNVTFHSDIKPEDAVAGEIFKAGISIKTADDGTGAIKVSAFVERNLCLNLIVIDTAVQQIVNRRHTGDERIIENIIKTGIKSANDKVSVFAEKWGVANKENLLTNTVDLQHLKDDSKSSRYSLNHELFMAGLFNGLMERELVTVKGKRNKTIDGLVESWQKEPALTKAGAINAITRFAHENNQKDPWMEDSLQSQAGSLLFRRQPLPWLLNKD